MKVCINSQTPLLRFKLSYEELIEKYGFLDDPVDISSLEQNVDYTSSPGGVTAMIYPLMNYMIDSNYVSSVVWVSLGVNYPPKVRMGKLLLSHVELEEKHLRKYTVFKESLWSAIHGVEKPSIDGYTYYAYYNWVNAERLLEHLGEIDVYYIQDFQLLLTGQMIGPSAPAVLRWHVPFKPENLTPLFLKFVLKAMEGFDSIVVSTRRDLEGLIKTAYHGRAYQIYPFIDPRVWQKPSRNELDNIKEIIGLQNDEQLILMVARMDRIKSQDTAIKAIARLKDKKLKLALVGNGSFSSSSKGGLAYGKGSSWRVQLQELANKLGVSDKVLFLGYLTHDQLRSIYNLASSVILTSRIEGFGITVLEGWMNKKPVVVSDGAGVSELVVEGSNGYVFTADDDQQLAEKIERTLSPASDKLGENGFETAKQCTIDIAAQREKTVLEETMAQYR